ncbi:tRNA (adenine-N(1)-)-methyltransferase catalytic subunit trm61 [Hypocenomyce scalaris]|nr:tRNA (adenine-N(1)-)-methyltransferase catalytic subunit trm61 [Hypocenomyce scalaris]
MTEVQQSRSSSFLDPGPAAETNSLAVLHLKRDLQIPTLLREQDEQNEGYDEGKVTNTRFGSFPHSTLIGVPWGSQVRASAVDTGSRGRRGNAKASKGEKRKRDGDGLEVGVAAKKLKTDVEGGEAGAVTSDRQELAFTPKAAVTASTGFIHILPPTPESWTTSLPHRTQVVYTPDYSYILHRLRARPGSVIIEAGAGSGSFTHAAARAVFNGYSHADEATELGGRQSESGKVWSFEFHEQRVEKLRTEIKEHCLDGIVEITHRDVCHDGFQPAVNADAVFLDLPAPWLALKHLTRSALPKTSPTSQSGSPVQIPNSPPLSSTQFRSPLNPASPIHLCTFSPCIEQVQRTVTTMRQLGWLDIQMVEIAAKRIEIRRERVGLQEEGLRGVNPSPASVDEAVARLKELEGRTKGFYEDVVMEVGSPASSTLNISKQQRLESIRERLAERKIWKEGRLVHRAEPELKTHTSYLVFAVLPREWTQEDEAKVQRAWPSKVAVATTGVENLSRRQMKRAAKANAGGGKEIAET